MSKNKTNQKNQASQHEYQGVLDGNTPSTQEPISSNTVEEGELLEQTTEPSVTVEDSENYDNNNEQNIQTTANNTHEVVKSVSVEVSGVSSVAPKEMAKQQAQNAMNIYIDRIKKDGTAGEKMVVDTMEAYLSVMNGGRPLDTNTIVREQTRLYTMFKNIGRRTDDFRKAVVVARFFFRENFDGAFHDIRINRGHESLQLSADDRKAFYSYLQLYKIIASVNDLKDIKKSVDVSRSLTNPVIPSEVKERYVSLIN